MPTVMSKNSLRKTPREFLSELAPDQLVRVGADKPATGAKTWPAGELLHDWNEQGSPYLDLDATVMNGRLYIPDPTDPKDLQVFLKIVDEPDAEGP